MQSVLRFNVQCDTSVDGNTKPPTGKNRHAESNIGVLYVGVKGAEKQSATDLRVGDYKAWAHRCKGVRCIELVDQKGPALVLTRDFLSAPMTGVAHASIVELSIGQILCAAQIIVVWKTGYAVLF